MENSTEDFSCSVPGEGLTGNKVLTFGDDDNKFTNSTSIGLGRDYFAKVSTVGTLHGIINPSGWHCIIP